jgi:hypothetical protein
MRRALLLSLVAVAAGSSAAAGANRTSGIDGKIDAGPTCPVERVPPDPRCAPRPLAATLKIHPAGRSSPRWTVRSGQDGRFRIRLGPGRYVVTAQPIGRSAFPRPPASRQVAVRPGRFTYTTITYDTGIR